MNQFAAILAEDLTMAVPSTIVLLILFFLLAVALGMFWTLVWRETSNRPSVALAEWARAARFRSKPPEDGPPVPLAQIGPRVRMFNWLVGPRCTLAQVAIDRPAEPATAAGVSRPVPPRRWNLLIWPIDQAWPPVALRPAHAANALADVIGLPPQPNESTHRFTVCSKDQKAARDLTRSSARGLMPPDVGLVLLGRYLLLDFSDRPFDGTEFNRMIAVAEQVVAHLPVR